MKEALPITDVAVRPPTTWEPYDGTTTVFAAAGFTEFARRGKRPVHRLSL